MRRLALAALVAMTGACDDGPAAGGGLLPIPDFAADAAPDASPDAALVARLWHVQPGATGGDGSRGRPFGDIGDAYGSARAGDLVWLLPGDHPTPTMPPAGVVLTGSGADVTRIAGPLVLDAAGLEMRELSVVGGDPALHARADVRLEGVSVIGDGMGFRVDARVDARDLSATGIRGVEITAVGQLDARGGALHGDEVAVINEGTCSLSAIGLSAPAGDGLSQLDGQATLDGVIIDGVGTGVNVRGGLLTLTESTARRVAAPGGVGAAVRVSDGRAVIDGLTVEEADRGLRVDARGQLEARIIRVVSPASEGLSVQGGEATVEGLVVEGPGNSGVAVLDSARLTLSDLTVSAPRRAGVIVNRATLSLTGALIEDSPGRGIALLGAEATIEGIAIRRAADVGLQITDPIGPVTVADSRFEDCNGSGISVFGDAGAPVVLRAVIVEGTQPGSGDLADGIHLFQAHARLESIVSRNNAGAGVLIEQSNGEVVGGELTDNTDPGLVVLSGLDPIAVSEVISRGNGGAGMLAIDGELRVSQSISEDNRASLAVGPGHGLHVVAGGRMTVDGGLSQGNAGAGVAFDPATTGGVDGITLADNGGYGLLVACGAEIDEGETVVYRDNTQGDRSVCP